MVRSDRQLSGQADRAIRDWGKGQGLFWHRGPARLKLDRLEAATTISDLAALPGNRFENLKGDRKGQCSIRINDKWRICFQWPAGSLGPINVEIVDYH